MARYGVQDVPVNQDAPTFPEAPAGFTQVSLFAYPDLFNLPASADLETISLDIVIPAQTTQGEWHAIMETVRAAAGIAGYDLAAYGVWEQPAGGVTVPSQVCLLGTCFDLPFGGQTIISSFDYHIWVILAQPGPSGYMRNDNHGDARGQVRALAPLLLAVIVIGALLSVVGIVYVLQINSGKATLKDFQDFVLGIINSPGENVAKAITAGAWPFAAAGAAMVAIALIIPQVVPNVTGSYTQKIPGGGQATVGGGVGPGASRRGR